MTSQRIESTWIVAGGSGANGLKHVWFKLPRVKLYLNDLRRNKIYFELAEGLSYLGFELPRVKLP